MRKSLTLAAILLSLTASAQFRVSVNAGYGSYSQPELKQLQQDILGILPVDGRITSSFPSFWYYHASALIGPWDRIYIGATFDWGTSGGRVSYNDYSGSFTNDMLVRYAALGMPVSFILNPASQWQVTADLISSIAFNELDFISETAIGSDYNRTSSEFNSFNLAMQPGIAIMRKFGRLGLNARAGYNLAAFEGKLFYSRPDDDYLINFDGEPVHMNWNGFRADIGVSVFFSKKQTHLQWNSSGND